MAKQRILITGASGFVGAALLNSLAADGCDITCIGRNGPASNPNVSFIEANLAVPGSLALALNSLKAGPGFDAIVHLAVSRHHREFPQKALDLFHVNAGSAAELLDFARVTGVSQVVLGSTGTVYSCRTSADDAGVAGSGEEEFNNPTSYFAASKLFADALCQFYRSSFAVSILRLYAPYGHGLSERMLTDLVARVRSGRPLSLPASGGGLAFAAIYIDDAVAVIRAALKNGWNETVNVAAPEVWTIESAGRLIGELVGREPIFERSAASFAPWVVPRLDRLASLMPDLRFTGLREGLGRMEATSRF
jgi:nucleoside-diphosphate-sugar epimerase